MQKVFTRMLWLGAFLVVFNLGYLIPAVELVQQPPAPQAMPDVGAWYSTWYAKLPPVQRTWIAGFGAGSAAQFLVDMNQDGMDDAVAYYAGNGSFLAAISDGTRFGEPVSMGTGLGIGSSAQFLADVNGDRLPDAIHFYSGNGTWRVGINNGTGFGDDVPWNAAFGHGSGSQMVGDADGDGRCDAIVAYGTAGKWAVAVSDGVSFQNGTATPWIQGFGSGSSNQMVKDIDHDGRVDALAFYDPGGQWYASQSNGTAFVGPYLWHNGHGLGSAWQAVANRPNLFKTAIFSEAFAFFDGDVNGDGLPGDWYVAGRGCMNTGFGAGSDQQFLGNVTGDERGWSASVAFFEGNGTWQVQPYYFTKKNIYDTWDAWNIRYRPWTLGSYQTYDSGNVSVIDEHLAMIAAAGIDFLLLDETNNLYVDEGYIFQRAKVLASRVNLWNSNASHRRVRYAIVIGGNQYSHNPASVENEAAEVWNQFVNTVDGGVDNYYHLDGKPLLVDYCPRADQVAWAGWTGAKPYAGRFSLRWASSPAGVDNYGWEIRAGSIPGEEVTIVMPGWNNNKGAEPVPRQHGFCYSQLSWEVVLATPRLPRIVVINSFNEYAEETAVAPADTSQVSGATERWTDRSGRTDAFMYWDMTVSYIQSLRNGGHLEYQRRAWAMVLAQAIPFAVLSVAISVFVRRIHRTHPGDSANA